MNILQTIWSALTQSNEMLFKIISIPLNYIDVLVCMLFFTAVLNININRKQKILYVLLYGSIATAITFLIPASYKLFFNIIIWPIMIFFILKTTVLKSILSVVLTLIITSILESIFINMFHILLNISFNDIAQIFQLFQYI